MVYHSNLQDHAPYFLPPPCIKNSRIKQKISNFIKEIVYKKLSCSISRIRKKMLAMKDKVSSR